MSNKRAAAAALVVVGFAAAACGSSSSGGTATNTPTAGSGGGSTAPSTSVPDVSASSLTQDFSQMVALKGVAAAGKGNIGVLLPDTTTSARYVEFDAPLLTKAFTSAGLKAGSDFTVQNAQGDAATQFTDAQSDITNGASVIIVDPINPGVGARIEKYGQANGVQVIDYDRLTLGGSRSYYISFNNVTVGKAIGTGFAACLKADKVAKPDFIEMKGDPTDNNATLFAQGYDSIIKQNPSWKKAAEPAGTWDPPTALTEFTQAFTANPGVNSAIIPNDENAAPIISYLKNQGVKANTFPITGQDATLIGLQNILSGFQCGTVYKPVYLEAQAAAAVALYIRDGQTPPADLVNGTTPDTQESNKAVPSVLLAPEWVTPKNMAATVVKDGSVTAKQICTSAYAAECKAAGITS